MPQPNPLSGRTIVVTRPQAQAQNLSRLLQATGANVALFPVISIKPYESVRLQTLSLADFDLAFFVSVNAVTSAFNALKAQAWPAHLAVSAVGAATAQALREKGFTHVIAPQASFDSEAVLALPEFSATTMQNKRVVIFCGQSGNANNSGSRDFLANTLHRYGAQVVCVPCYQRECANISPQSLISLATKRMLDALTFTSSEGVRYFTQIITKKTQNALPYFWVYPCFAPHPRIAEQLKTLGAQRIVLTDPADEGLLNGLTEYFSKNPQSCED